MWVVKLGGSLNAHPQLAAWLEALASLGGGRVALVAGGGGFADVARQVQAQWQIDDLAAHNMAVLAMAQSGLLLQALEPRLAAAASEADIRAALRRGQAVIWMPFSMLRDVADDITNWEVTADSLALHLARRLNAERLLLVKACSVDAAHSLARQSELGIVDKRFARWAQDADCSIDIVSVDALPAVRERLMGNGHWPGQDGLAARDRSALKPGP